MKIQDLLEMPQLTRRELGDDPDDDHQPMTAFFITTERLQQRYKVIGQQDNAFVAISKDHTSALVGVFGHRDEDNAEGGHIFGDLQFKTNANLGFRTDQLQLHSQNVLQVSLVNVVKTNQFMGLGSFLYSSLAQAGFTIVSDIHHFIGGKALWQKLARARRPDEVVYVMDKGRVLTGEDGRPLEYDGTNIPDDKIWSDDARNKYVLLVYKRR